MKALCLYLHMVLFVFHEIWKFGRNLLSAKFGSERVKARILAFFNLVQKINSKGTERSSKFYTGLTDLFCLFWLSSLLNCPNVFIFGKSLFSW